MNRPKFNYLYIMKGLTSIHKLSMALFRYSFRKRIKQLFQTLLMDDNKACRAQMASFDIFHGTKSLKAFSPLFKRAEATYIKHAGLTGYGDKWTV